MGHNDSFSFSCTECRARYRWRAELAGARIRCKACGAMVNVRRENVPVPPAKLEQKRDDFSSIDEAFEQLLVESESIEEPNVSGCPSCAAAMPPEAVVCTLCGFNKRLGQRVTVSAARLAVPGVAAVPAMAGGIAPAPEPLGYFGRAAPLPFRGEDEGLDLAHQIREYYAPIALIVIGIALSYAEWMHFKSFPYDFAMASVVIAVRCAIELVLFLGGCLFVLRVMQTPFGSPGPAVLKLISVALLPGAIGSITTFVLEDPTGWLGWFVSLMVIYAMLFFLFDMEFFDVCVLTTIVWLIRIWLGLLILGAIMQLITGSALPSSVAAPDPDAAQPKLVIDQILDEHGRLRIDDERFDRGEGPADPAEKADEGEEGWMIDEEGLEPDAPEPVTPAQPSPAPRESRLKLRGQPHP